MWTVEEGGKKQKQTVCGRKRVTEDSMFAVKGEIGFRASSLVYFSN